MVSIVPITELRNTSRIFDMSEKEPVYITKNGYGSRVLMNIELFNKVKEMLLDLELEEEFQRSEREGDNVDAREFIRKLRNE
jgi:PHD/YefM family antitoxin component YafN of YafNO toxin-antitoxin module